MTRDETRLADEETIALTISPERTGWPWTLLSRREAVLAPQDRPLTKPDIGDHTILRVIEWVAQSGLGTSAPIITVNGWNAGVLSHIENAMKNLLRGGSPIDVCVATIIKAIAEAIRRAT